MFHKHRILIAVILFLAVASASLFHPASPVLAQTPVPDKGIHIYFFWGEGCPHCAAAKPFFDSLTSKYPEVVYHSFEVYYDQPGQQFFMQMAQKYGVQQLAVPTFFIGPYYLQGYSDEFIPDIIKVVEYCRENGCVDAGEGLLPGSAVGAPTRIQTISPTATASPPQPPSSSDAPAMLDSTEILDQSSHFKIPLLGEVNLTSQPVILSTILIALVDGFNPCSLWVLSMLLALTLHTRSRKKVFVIGVVFLTVTAAIYALFIAGLFSVLTMTGFLRWIQVLIGVIALIFAAVNIKDYFWYQEGISFTISDDKKAGIFKRMRAVLDASQTWWGLISATVVLAAGVSIVEFSCTAGFPIVWVNLLGSQNIAGGAFFALLLIYMLIYQLDEMVIFFSAVISLKSTRLEEKHGRLLKLIGGMLMLTLSITMLIDPALMNSLAASLIIFLVAFALTGCVLLIHRVLLPKLGISIGSE
jgi:thiol-disulfide isomerase/thioredoxin